MFRAFHKNLVSFVHIFVTPTNWQIILAELLLCVISQWSIQLELVLFSTAWKDKKYFYCPLNGLHTGFPPVSTFASTNFNTWMEKGTLRALGRLPTQTPQVQYLPMPKKIEILLYQLSFIHLLLCDDTNAATQVFSKVITTISGPYFSTCTSRASVWLCQIYDKKNYSFKRVNCGIFLTHKSNVFSAFKQFLLTFVFSFCFAFSIN